MSIEIVEITKEDLLEHYAMREPSRWVQFDALHQPGGDGLAEDDENGDIAYVTETLELWTGHFPVRVHIRRGLDRETALRLLSKITAWVETWNDGIEMFPDDMIPTPKVPLGGMYHSPGWERKEPVT